MSILQTLSELVSRDRDLEPVNPPRLMGVDLDKLRRTAALNRKSVAERASGIKVEIARLELALTETIQAGDALDAALNILDAAPADPIEQAIGRALRPPQETTFAVGIEAMKKAAPALPGASMDEARDALDKLAKL